MPNRGILEYLKGLASSAESSLSQSPQEIQDFSELPPQTQAKNEDESLLDFEPIEFGPRPQVDCDSNARFSENHFTSRRTTYRSKLIILQMADKTCYETKTFVEECFEKLSEVAKSEVAPPSDLHLIDFLESELNSLLRSHGKKVFVHSDEKAGELLFVRVLTSGDGKRHATQSDGSLSLRSTGLLVS